MKKFVYILFLFVAIFSMFLNTQNCLAENTDIFEKNAIRIVKKVDENGEIALSYIFPVNSDFLNENYSESDVSVYKFYLANYVLALSKTFKKKQNDDVFISNCEYYTDIDGFGFSIIFKNQTAQNQFFEKNQIDANKSQNSKNLTTEGVFLKKTYIKTTFPVSDLKSAGDLKMVCVLAISSWAKECEISQEKKQQILEYLSKTKFIYDFASTQKILNSEVMYEDEKYCHNVFSKTQDDIEKDNSICFWLSYVDKGLCCLCVVIFVVFGVVASLLILKFRKKL